MRVLDKVMWMGAGLGAGLLYKTYEKDICNFMNKEKEKMMKVGNAMCDKDSSN